MDQDRFDRLARRLGAAATRRDGLRAALGGILGLGAGASALGMDADAKRGRRADADADADADATKKRRKKRCKPACTDGFECVKVGKKRACECVTGAVCGTACCRIGQTCQDGKCVPEPEPAACIAAAEPCKNAGRPCCDGRVCASGQRGDGDVACYAPKTGACERTSDCVYGMSCRSGRCEPPQPGDLATPCDAAAQQLCTTPGAVCTAYDGSGAPGGSFCTLPLESACSGDKECTCYKCWYVNPGTRGTTRAAARFACCGPDGYVCRSDRNCCLGTTCVNGVCRGEICVPDDAPGCAADADCCTSTALCREGICRLGVPAGERCSTDEGSLPCLTPGTTCQAYTSGDPDGTYCLKELDGACAAAGAVAADATCISQHCVAGTCQLCGTDAHCPTGKICDPRADSDTQYTCVECTADDATECASATPVCKTGDTVCVACNAATDCPDPGSCKIRGCTGNACVPTNKTDNTACTITNANDGFCSSGTCTLKRSNGATCTDTSQCRTSTATCRTYDNSKATATYCLLANAATCFGSSECAGNSCISNACVSCAVATSGGVQPYTVQEAIDLEANGQPVYSTVTLAPGTYTGTYTIDRSVTIEACIATSKPTLIAYGAVKVITIAKSTSGTRAVTLRNLQLGNSGFYTTMVDANGGDAATEKLTLTVDSCTAEASYGSAAEAPIDISDGYLDATFTNCTFQGAMIKAVSTRTTAKNSVTVTGSTLTGRRDASDPSACGLAGNGNPRAFTIQNVNLSVENSTIEKYKTDYAGNGGAILASGGANVILKGSTQVKTNRVVNGSGGGIYFDQSTSINTLKLETSASGTPKITGNGQGSYLTSAPGTNGAGIYLSAAPSDWSTVFLGGVTTANVTGNKYIDANDCTETNATDNQCRTPSGSCTFNT